MDTLANMLVSIKNAGLVNKTSVVIPSSKMKVAVLELLKREGYVKAINITEGIKPTVEIALVYVNKLPRITNVKRVSKPSKRVYAGVKDIESVKYGHGISVLSTPKGIMTDKEARKEMVGGEVLFKIW